MIALPSQLLALDGDVKVGRAETRGCSYPGGVGPWGETPSGALEVNLKATEKEPCSNAGSWDRCQEQSSQRGHDGTKRRCSRSGHLGANQDRPAGMLQGCGTQGRAHFIGALKKDWEKGTPAPIGAFPPTRQRGGEGEEPREKSRDGTSGDWQLALQESSHLVRELRRFPAASSAESACLS